MAGLKAQKPAAGRRKAAGDADRNGTEEILGAAALMFMRRGFAATSIDEIAAVLGSTKGRIYHHYGSKAALFFDVHHIALRRMLDMARPIAQADASPSVKLRTLAHAQALAIMTNFAPNKVALQGLERHVVRRNGGSQRRIVRKIVELRDEYEGLFVGLIEDGIRTGEFASCSVRVVAKAVLGAINWLAIWFNPEQTSTPAELDHIARTIADFVTRGLQPGVLPSRA